MQNVKSFMWKYVFLATEKELFEIILWLTIAETGVTVTSSSRYCIFTYEKNKIKCVIGIEGICTSVLSVTNKIDNEISFKL